MGYETLHLSPAYVQRQWDMRPAKFQIHVVYRVPYTSHHHYHNHIPGSTSYFRVCACVLCELTIMIVAQRRGKAHEKASTVLVDDEEDRKSIANNNNTHEVDPLFLPAGGGGGYSPPVRMATVRRNYCGTGPFDQHWLNLDCCGLFCALFTYGLHVYGVYAVALILLPPWMSTTEESTGIRTVSLAGQLHRFAFTAIAVLAIISHFKAMTTDPGAVPPDAKPLEVSRPDPAEDASQQQQQQERNYLLDPPEPNTAVKRICRRCKSFKPQRAHHCSVCRRCIIKMDHHCPWVNNCVGIGNHKYFLLFVFYTFLSCCYSLTLVLTRFTTCNGVGSRAGHRLHGHIHRIAAVVAASAGADLQNTHHHLHNATCLDRPSHLLLILGLLIEALLFGLFTSCMMFDQVDVVRSKMTHIDRYKGGDAGGSLAGVTEVFGISSRQGLDANFRADWLSPFFRVCFPTSVRNEVMGFCRPCQTNAREAVSAVQTAMGGLSSRPKGPAGVVEIV